MRPPYAKTINRSQMETLLKCGLEPSDVPFAHEQLYVALSRVLSRSDILILLKSGKLDESKHVITKNVIHPEFLH